MLVDIGGATVDAAIFNVVIEKDEYAFKFFRSSVSLNGARLLHTSRLGYKSK